MTNGVYADIEVSYDKIYGTLKLTVNKEGETSFVVNTKNESSRFLAGFLPIQDRLKIFFTI